MVPESPHVVSALGQQGETPLQILLIRYCISFVIKVNENTGYAFTLFIYDKSMIYSGVYISLNDKSHIEYH